MMSNFNLLKFFIPLITFLLLTYNDIYFLVFIIVPIVAIAGIFIVRPLIEKTDASGNGCLVAIIATLTSIIAFLISIKYSATYFTQNSDNTEYVFILLTVLAFSFLPKSLTQNIPYRKKTALISKAQETRENKANFLINMLSQRVSEHPLWMFSIVSGITVSKLSSLNASYQEVLIRKKTGGTRKLLIPNDELKDTQKSFAEFINQRFKKKMHPACHSYRKHKSILSNAIAHLSCSVLVKLDIKDYFQSITFEQVKNTLELGLNSIDFHPEFDFIVEYGKDNLTNIQGYLGTKEAQEVLKKLVYSDNGLPQGAPTSPVISNLVLSNFDKEVYALVTSLNGAYTRYSDDITISFKEDSSQKVAQVIKFVEAKLAENGFKLNKKKGKINVLRPHQAQRICGVTINSGKPTISRKQRRLIRAAQHNAKQSKPTTFTEDQIKGHLSFQTYVKEHGELLAQNERIEYLKDGSISARGCKANKGYTILKGSRFDASKIGESKQELKALFDELVNDGVIVEKDKSIAKFKRHHQFKSKTLATSLLYMRNVRPIGRWS